ncbi:MAG: hypothetical protein OXE85_08790 [Roseovarius sp.]|nr:hypothetical protein [Roseovarius sp.]MCY4317571.1 hypothetical protein [Roseovarius sp.]
MIKKANNDNSSENVPELFHYTSITALEGILETNTLWASHARFLNDSSEFDLMWVRVNETLELLLDGQDIDLTTAVIWQGIINKANLDRLKPLALRECAPFIASFTTHEGWYEQKNSLLSQWRGYGRNGLIIVFNGEMMLRRISRIKADICRVTYDKGDHDLKMWIENGVKNMLNDRAIQFNASCDADPNPYLARFIARHASMLKHRGLRKNKRYV